MLQYKISQCDILNVKLPNLQINKLKSEIKNRTEVTLKILSNVVGNSNDENNFTNKFLLTNAQVSRLSETFENNSLANIKLTETQCIK